MSDRFSESVLRILKQAGWFEGRRFKPGLFRSRTIAPFEAAQKVLDEFQGLHIGECGPGMECATSDVEIDPALTIDLGEELHPFEATMGKRLFGLGEIHRSHGPLIIDENGRIYVLTDTLEFLANSFDNALEKLVLGLLPDES